MASPEWATRVPLPRLARVVALVEAPIFAALLALAWGDWLDPLPALIALVFTAATTGYVVRRHLASLEALRVQVDKLAREEPQDRNYTPSIEIPTNVPGLGQAVAELDRSWVRRGEELRAVIGANEAILEAIPDPLILIDARRRVTRANSAARAMFGDTIAGRDLAATLRHPDVLEVADEGFAGRSTSRTVDFTWPGPPERDFSVRFALLPRLRPYGSDMLLILRDVTALKQAEKMRADFVANVSHELRTPLSAILGFTETLRGAARDDAEARDRFLGIMHEQSQRMTRLVRDLLSLSRIEESEYTLPTEQVEIARVVGSVADTLLLQARSKGSVVELDLGNHLPAVTGDSDQLAQVFQNLIDNAIKYGKANGKVRVVARTAAAPPPRIAASAAPRSNERPPAWISVAIADDGEGIPREHLPRLTERFYRVDPARSRQLGGTGLGLAIVKHILNRHRGALAIESEPGRGSVFTVWLPAGPARPASA
jgi:two-component system phosphate regulon sensor histidine kinase PhoR